jgi:probable rRNA maturation factor
MITIRNETLNTRISPKLRLMIRTAVKETLKYCGKNPEEFSLDVSILDKEAMRAVNLKYRGKDKSTDVLSFPLGINGKWDIDPETDTFLLGDTLISIDDASNQALAYGHSLLRETAFLTVHSVLHLLGFDHETSQADEDQMFAIQDDVMKKIAYRLKSPTVSETAFQSPPPENPNTNRAENGETE